MKMKTLTALVVWLTCVFALATMAGANGGFSVTPVFPSNQNPESTGAFNLNVTPGQRQEIAVMVNNPQDEPITVEISLISPGTNRNGIIDYTGPGRLDETIEGASFSDIAHLTVSEDITVPANMSAEIPVIIEIPQDGIEGVMLGAVHVLLGITDEEVEDAGMIVNRFAHVISVRLQEEGASEPPADFALGEVRVDLVNHRAAIVADVRNPQPRFAMGAIAHAQVYPAGSDQPMFTAGNVGVDFAPNSIFPFSMTDEGGYGIPPGSYIARVQIEHDGQNWEFEETFTVAAQAAAVVNAAAVNQQASPYQLRGGFPAWGFAAIGAGVILLIGLTALILRSKSKSRKEIQQLMEQIEQQKKPD